MCLVHLINIILQVLPIWFTKDIFQFPIRTLVSFLILQHRQRNNSTNLPKSIDPCVPVQTHFITAVQTVFRSAGNRQRVTLINSHLTDTTDRD